MKRIGVALVALICLLTIAIGVAEIHHRFKFGHFVGYGINTDVVLGNSDVGNSDMYYAWARNITFRPFPIEGCREASDVGGRPDSVYYHWDVQKLDHSNQRWISLDGADTWVPTAFGGSWREVPCRPVKTLLQPLGLRRLAWVFKDWVTTGEPVRMAIHSSATVPPEAQKVIYTELFIVRPPTSGVEN